MNVIYLKEVRRLPLLIPTRLLSELREQGKINSLINVH
jgi:hypothetical protein